MAYMKDRSVVRGIEINYKSGNMKSQIFTLFDKDGRKIEDVHNYISRRMRDFLIDEENYPNLEVLSIINYASFHIFSWRHSKLKHLSIIDSYMHENLDITLLPSLETLSIGYNDQATKIRLKIEV